MERRGPGWDSLTEDWPSRPPSSSGSNLPNGQSLNEKGNPTISNTRRGTTSKTHATQRSSRSSSHASQQSVIRHENPKNISQVAAAQANENGLPDWKRLALKYQVEQSAGNDLLSPGPMGLEKVFQKPNTPPEPAASKNGRRTRPEIDQMLEAGIERRKSSSAFLAKHHQRSRSIISAQPQLSLSPLQEVNEAKCLPSDTLMPSDSISEVYDFYGRKKISQLVAQVSTDGCEDHQSQCGKTLSHVSGVSTFSAVDLNEILKNMDQKKTQEPKIQQKDTGSDKAESKACGAQNPKVVHDHHIPTIASEASGVAQHPQPGDIGSNKAESQACGAPSQSVVHGHHVPHNASESSGVAQSQQQEGAGSDRAASSSCGGQTVVRHHVSPKASEASGESQDPDPFGGISDLVETEEVSQPQFNTPDMSQQVVAQIRLEQYAESTEPVFESLSDYEKPLTCSQGSCLTSKPSSSSSTNGKLVSDDNMRESSGYDSQLWSDSVGVQRLARSPAQTVQSKRRPMLAPSSIITNNLELHAGEYVEEPLNSATGQQSSPTEEIPRDNDSTTEFKSPQPLRQANDASYNAQCHTAPPSSMEKAENRSFFEPRSDGHNMSLGLSYSTPVPARYSDPNQSLMPSTGKGYGRSFKPLSPLTELTVDQDDARHFKSGNAQSAPDNLLDAARGDGHMAFVINDMVRRLTDAASDEPYWDSMKSVDLSGTDLDDLDMLENFCPRLVELRATDNKLRHLNGAPSSLRELDLARNQLSGLTSWAHLPNLQYLDLSGNQIDSLKGLSGLVHLRHLVLDNNAITSLDGILHLEGLQSISLKGNKIQSADFKASNLKRLERVDLSDNDLVKVTGLSRLTSLKEADFSGNRLLHFPATPDEKKVNGNRGLTTLHLDRNRISKMDVAAFPQLETLTVDENRLTRVHGIAQHKNMRLLSFRDQTFPDRKPSINKVPLNDFHNLHTLILSGTPLPYDFPIMKPFLNLQVLDVSFTGLQSLPTTFGKLAPNLRNLNVSANALKDLRPLDGIVGLETLSASGNRIVRVRALAKVLERLNRLCGGRLREVDFRDNPFSQGFYPPQSSAKSAGSQRRQELYAARLDPDTAERRTVWEMLVATTCAAILKVDGKQPETKKWQSDKVWTGLKKRGVITEKATK
ncbi:MAG: hypothetical protein M1831_003548 [Alyxoria varia]|nr:MAG: hypothetical protein M1831_003548 [Alyxoria varia]